MKTKRLGIYFLFDKDGIVEEQIQYFLKSLKEHLSELAVVVNGFVNDEGKKVLEKIADTLIIRENKGFDSWAYKTAFEHYGYENLNKFDEVLTCNFTCYGPVYPFSVMFDKMAKSDCDFWGACAHVKIDDFVISDKQKTSYLPEHIMSYFTVVRNRMLSSKHFREYWQNLPPIKSYSDAIALHEAVFSGHFEGLGFKSDTFISKEFSSKINDNASIYRAYDMLEEEKCPIVKRKIFFTSPKIFNKNGIGDQVYKTFKHIKEKTNYNTDFIVDDILHQEKGYSVREGFNLNLVIPDNHIKNKDAGKKAETALIAYLETADDIEFVCNNILNMPEKSDVYIYYGSKDLKSIIEPKLKSGKFGKIEYKFIVDEKFILLNYLGKDIYNYDFVCSICSKNLKFEDMFISQIFKEHCLDGVLKTKELAINVIDEFEKDKRLGVVSSSSIYTPALSRNVMKDKDIIRCYDKVSNLIKAKTGISLCAIEKADISFENCFWFRPLALKKLIDANWNGEDFSSLDDYSLFILDSIYPLLSQYHNYYYAWAMSSEMASVHINNLVAGYYRQDITKTMNRNKLKKLKSLKKKYKILYYLTFKSKKYKNLLDGVKTTIKKYYL